jgi:hypothetical protein
VNRSLLVSAKLLDEGHALLKLGLLLLEGLNLSNDRMQPGGLLLRARNLGDLIIAFLKALSWPFSKQMLPAFGIYLPLLFLAHRVATRRDALREEDWTLFAFGIWTVLLAAVTSYGRGAKGAGPEPHYMDNLAVGLLVNLSVLVHLASTAAPRARARAWPFAAGIAAWLVLVASGFVQSTGTVFKYFPLRYKQTSRMRDSGSR